MYSTQVDRKEIAIALSGGGIRAMVFHLGVLTYLAEQKRLEQITHISSVSGGSLIVGLIFQEAGMQWPTSEMFLQRVAPRVKQILCTKSLISGTLKQFINPLNLKYLFSRANVVSKALAAEWQIHAKLTDLPDLPYWSINGTVGETGKRFRFKKQNFGDYESGYVKSTEKDFSLADAMAVSAAFPVGIGPLSLETKAYTWYKRKWNQPPEAEKVYVPKHDRLHLYDGGVYDNLGLEAFFDIATNSRKAKLSDKTVLIVSDASSPLDEKVPSLYKIATRFIHIIDIVYNQNRSLRIRNLLNYLKQNKGVYLPIKTQIPHANGDDQFAMTFSTSLKKLTPEEFDKLYQHGYNVCHKYYFFIAEKAEHETQMDADIF